MARAQNRDGGDRTFRPPSVPPEVAAADTVKNEIIAGVRHPFTGPITDVAGIERVSTGLTIPDEELDRMDWYVKGMQA
jgi:basic membrane protein A and related proteins